MDGLAFPVIHVILSARPFCIDVLEYARVQQTLQGFLQLRNQAAALFGHVGDAGFIHADIQVLVREEGEPKIVRDRNCGALGFAHRLNVVAKKINNAGLGFPLLLLDDEFNFLLVIEGALGLLKEDDDPLHMVSHVSQVVENPILGREFDWKPSGAKSRCRSGIASGRP